jgi:hypothetical protein
MAKDSNEESRIGLKRHTARIIAVIAAVVVAIIAITTLVLSFK